MGLESTCCRLVERVWARMVREDKYRGGLMVHLRAEFQISVGL